MPTMDVEKEIHDLKRRVDLAETKLAQHSGQFEFISGQLRDVQLFMHARFADMDEKFVAIDQRLEKMDRRFDAMDRRFDAIDRRFDMMEVKIDSLPRIIAELIAPKA